MTCSFALDSIDTIQFNDLAAAAVDKDGSNFLAGALKGDGGLTFARNHWHGDGFYRSGHCLLRGIMNGKKGCVGVFIRVQKKGDKWVSHRMELGCRGLQFAFFGVQENTDAAVDFA